jgi:hypothetical protein
MKVESLHASPTFSINDYDSDGDIFGNGVFLHFGDTRIKISDDIEGFNGFIDHLKGMRSEISENL